jgi:hypothetical protein
VCALFRGHNARPASQNRDPLWFPKIRSERIRTVKQNQGIISWPRPASAGGLTALMQTKAFEQRGRCG